ncbi:MAG: substrate-binding domain-containing protein [Pseudomonadota bacterium]|nr:substrate-binding domain-containing protein [Pseudomonadota bacterium]
MSRFIFFIFLISVFFSSLSAETRRLRLSTTTSIENSGLLAKLHPPFEKKYNVKIDVIAVGTGKAIRLAENGDVDVMLVHAPKAEFKFIEEGYGIERLSVMQNDFIIVGPNTDPANLKYTQNIKDALFKLADTENLFISRGDDSGTNKKEKYLWEMVDLKPNGDWYLSVGQGMGQTLIIADNKQAYTLSDRGTYLAYKEKITLSIVFENDHQLQNPYHVIIVSPEKHPHVNYILAKKYVEFIRSEEGQGIIKDFKVNGEKLFLPN